MTLTVELPDDVMSCEQPGREALEALGVEAYRSGALSKPELRRLMNVSRWELEGILKRHGVERDSYGVDDFKHDLAVLGKLEAERASSR